MSNEPLWVPHLASCEEDGHVRWYVRMREAPGEYVTLTETFRAKLTAARHLKTIRRKMGQHYLKGILNGQV